MPDAVIVSTARTPIGRAFKGTLVDVDAFELAQHVVVAALRRSGLDPALVDDMVIGRDAVRRRRHRPLRGDRGGHRARARRRRESTLCGRADRGHDRRGLDPRRHGSRRDRGRRPTRCRRRRVRCGARSAPTTGRTGCRRATATHRPRRTSTCRSPWAGTPRSRPACRARRWTRGRRARTSARSPASTRAASRRRSRRSR